MATPPPRRGPRRWWRWARTLLSLGLLGVAVWFVVGKSSELSGASAFLTHIRWQWLALGWVAEVGSYVALAELQRVLLRAGPAQATLGRATLITFSGSAIQAALPGGAAFAAVYQFRQYRYIGADDVMAGFVVVGSSVMAFATLSTLAGLGLGLAASTGSTNDLVEAILGVLLVAALLALAWARRDQLNRLAVKVTGAAEHTFKKPPGHWSEPLGQLLGRARQVAPSRPDLGRGFAVSTCSWLSDCMCLALAFLAVGAHVPWVGLLLAYCGGQLAVNLPITPGGLGVVEGSLTVALVAFGGAQASTVAAVLLYRVLSYWLPLPVGAAAYLALWRRRHRKGVQDVRPEP